MHHTRLTRPYFTLNVRPFTPEGLHAKLLELLKGLALAERRVRCGRSRLREERITRSSSRLEDFRHRSWGPLMSMWQHWNQYSDHLELHLKNFQNVSKRKRLVTGMAGN